MTATPPKRRPTFVWQAILILLPVVLLAAVSIWALQTDRAAVERQAQSRTKSVSAAVAAEIEKFLHPGRVESEGVVYPVRFTVFLVSPSNTVISPARLVWPPEPMPLPADLSGLIKSNKLEQWQAAETSFNARNWSQALEFYDAFLDGDPLIDPLTEAG